MTNAGKDVPIEGTLHVKPDDGTVLRTRFRMQNFVDVSPEAQTPAERAQKFESEADIDVTYAKPPGIDLWFPASMVELYQGPMRGNFISVMSRAVTRATYSDFRQFGTSIKIVQ